jgi:hypothetical protein
MQTGQNVHDPLTQLNGHLGFGNMAVAGLNPFADMGLNPNDPNMVGPALERFLTHRLLLRFFPFIQIPIHSASLIDCSPTFS